MHVRNKLEKTTAALARISAYKSQDITKKWLNLIFMIPPIDENEEEKSKDLKPSHSEQYFKRKEGRARFTGGEIIIYNLNRLGLNVSGLTLKIIKKKAAKNVYL